MASPKESTAISDSNSDLHSASFVAYLRSNDFREQTMSDIDTFLAETRAWLEENCPASMRNRSFHWEDTHQIYDTDDARQWLKAMAARGWTAPTWPAKYSGGGLAPAQAQVL